MKSLTFAVNGDGKIDLCEFHAFLGFPNCHFCCPKDVCGFCGVCCFNLCLSDVPCFIHNFVHGNIDNSFKAKENKINNNSFNRKQINYKNLNLNNMKNPNEPQNRINKIKQKYIPKTNNQRSKTPSMTFGYENNDPNMPNENNIKNTNQIDKNKQLNNNYKNILNFNNFKNMDNLCQDDVENYNCNYNENLRQSESSNSFIGHVSDNLVLRPSPQRKYSPTILHCNPYRTSFCRTNDYCCNIIYKPEPCDKCILNHCNLCHKEISNEDECETFQYTSCQICHNLPCCCCSICHFYPCKCQCCPICHSYQCKCCPKCNNFPCKCCPKCNSPECMCCPNCKKYPCKCCPECHFEECCCCKICHKYPCVCCPNCHYANCRCCTICNSYPCVCCQICHMAKCICCQNCKTYPCQCCPDCHSLDCQCCSQCGCFPCRCCDMRCCCNMCGNIQCGPCKNCNRNPCICCPYCNPNPCHIPGCTCDKQCISASLNALNAMKCPMHNVHTMKHNPGCPYAAKCPHKPKCAHPKKDNNQNDNLNNSNFQNNNNQFYNNDSNSYQNNNNSNNNSQMNNDNFNYNQINNNRCPHNGNNINQPNNNNNITYSYNPNDESYGNNQNNNNAFNNNEPNDIDQNYDNNPNNYSQNNNGPYDPNDPNNNGPYNQNGPYNPNEEDNNRNNPNMSYQNQNNNRINPNQSNNGPNNQKNPNLNKSCPLSPISSAYPPNSPFFNAEEPGEKSNWIFCNQCNAYHRCPHPGCDHNPNKRTTTHKCIHEDNNQKNQGNPNMNNNSNIPNNNMATPNFANNNYISLNPNQQIPQNQSQGNMNNSQGRINTSGSGKSKPKRKRDVFSTCPYQEELGQFVDFLGYLMEVESKIEDMKIELARREDFNFEDIFRIFEVDEKGYIEPEDLKQGLKLLGLDPSDFDIKLLMKRFDLNQQGLLTYSDFFDMVVSFEKRMRNTVQIRPPNSCCPCKSPDVFECDTLIAIKNLFKFIIECERDINQIRAGFDSLRSKYSDVVQFLDYSRRGVINRSDLKLYLTQFNKFTTSKECDLLFIRLDKTRSGEVGIDEIENELMFIR